MEEKKRTLLAVVISCIILIAVVYSFGLNFFRSTPEIVVADPTISPSQPLSTDSLDGQGGILVEVTPETVQSIIASMSRYKSYQRTVGVQYRWESGASEVITAQVRVDGGWSRCDVTLASGMVEHSITGDGTVWYWYDESLDYVQAPAAGQTEDLLQHIPTYEDVLALDPSEITDTGYEEKNGVPCVFLEVKREPLGYVERYWISENSGLLKAAETLKDGAAVYAMSSGDVVSPLSGEADAFTLPDGTVLYVPAD